MEYIFLIFVILKLLSCVLTVHFRMKYRKYAVILNPITTLLCICIIWIYANGSINEALPITICLVAYEIVLQIIMFSICFYTRKSQKRA